MSRVRSSVTARRVAAHFTSRPASLLVGLPRPRASEISPADAGSFGQLPEQRLSIVHRRQAGEVLADISGRAPFPRWAILQEWQARRDVALIQVDMPSDDV